MTSPAALLPPHLLDALGVGLVVGVPAETRLDAALLLADISGFTALTERLQASGREGAEEMAIAIDRAFAPAITAIEAWRGSIVSFGGDSLFALFAGTAALGWAHGAAREIRARFGELPPVETSTGQVQLRIKQAIHFGSVIHLHLGAGRRRGFVATGPGVLRVARLARRARPGCILATPSGRLAGKTPARPGRQAPRPRRDLGVYLPPELRRRVAVRGAFRRVAVLFVETAPAPLDAMQGFWARLTGTLEAYGGVLLKTDLSPGGVRWMCVFGMFRGEHDDGERAARTAIELIRPDDTPRIRAGLGLGTAVRVVFGSRTRRSIDLIGDVVNLAARLSDRARWGETLVSEPMASSLPGAVTRQRGSLRLRGKSIPVVSQVLLRLDPVSAITTVRTDEPIAGCSRAVKVLQRAVDAAVAGRGGCVVIRGEDGMGKSRLAVELGRIASARGASVHLGQASPFRGAPFRLVADVLANALATPGDLVASMPEADRRHLGEIMGTEGPDGGASTEGEARRLGHWLAITRAVVALARERPRVFVLEDLHHADHATREFLPFMVRRLADSPVLVAVTTRPDPPPPSDLTPVMTLEPLHAATMARLVAARFPRPSKSLVRFVTERAGGNPLYASELMAQLQESAAVRRTARGTELDGDVSLEPPASLEALALARLDRLSEAGRRAIEGGAVLGASFGRELLERVAGAGSAAGIDELLSRGIVHRSPSGQLTFASALLREAAHRSMLRRERRRLHARAARLIRQQRPYPHALVGQHWEQAGRPLEARSCYLAAGRRASVQGAWEDAAQVLEAGLRLSVARDRHSTRARASRGSALQRLGKVHAALQEVRQAVREARAQRDAFGECEALRLLAASLRERGRMKEARRALDAAFDTCPPRARALRAGLVSALATQLHDEGHPVEALPIYEEAARALERCGDALDAARVRANSATVLHQLGRIPEARMVAERSMNFYRREHCWHFLCMALSNLALIETESGRYRSAAAKYRECLRITRRIGLRRVEAVALANLGNLAHERGRLEEAGELYRQALAIAQEVEERRLEGHLQSCLGALHLELGHLDEAWAHLERALRNQRTTQRRHGEGMALHIMSTCRRLQGRLAAAERLARRAVEVLSTCGSPIERAKAQAELGMIVVARGRAGAAHLRRAIEFARAHDGGLEGPVAAVIRELADACGGSVQEGLHGRDRRRRQNIK